jgi:hypothetical protein
MPADETVTAARGQVRRAQTLDQIGVTLVGVVAMAVAHYLVGAATTALATAVAEQRRSADEYGCLSRSAARR